MRKFIDIVAEATTRDGHEVELTYREHMDRLKPGIHCDGIEAWIEGAKVGYIKFDYTSREIMKELPTLWAYAEHYTGLPARQLSIPYRDMTAADALAALRTIKLYGRFDDNEFTQNPAGETFAQLGNEKVEPREGDRRYYIEMLRALEKTRYGKRLAAERQKFYNHASKPFVSYINTQSNYSDMPNDNSRRGIGSILYRAAAHWIADRNIAKGLYASSLQSDTARPVWDIFTERGWVTEDGDRRYLDPTRFPKP